MKSLGIGQAEKSAETAVQKKSLRLLVCVGEGGIGRAGGTE